LEPEVGEPLVFDQYDYPVTLRYGVTANATVSFELSGDPNSLFFEADVVQGEKVYPKRKGGFRPPD